MSDQDDVVRVAVVHAGKPLSGSWRIWRRNNDVYVAPRAVAGKYKVSLHASGRFRFGFTSDKEATRFLRAGSDRAAFKWERPSPESTVAVLLQIIFPASCLLAPVHTPKLHEDLVELGIPREGSATVVSVIETMLDSTATKIVLAPFTARTLARWDLPDGRQIWVVEHEETSSEEFVKQLGDFRQSLPAMTKSIPEDRIPRMEMSHLRSFVSMHSPDGIVRFVDIDAEHIRSR